MVTRRFSDQECVRRGAQRVANTFSHMLCSLLPQRETADHIGIQTGEGGDKEEGVFTSCQGQACHKIKVGGKVAMPHPYEITVVSRLSSPSA